MENTITTIDLTPALQALIMLLSALITSFAVPWLKAKLKAQQWDALVKVTRTAVFAAEQVYGSGWGRDKLRYAEEYKQGTAPELTEESFGSYLFSAGVPDPDLLIRPGGELRLSNFLMWQSAYSELYFTDTLWPDFTEEEINRAIAEFQRRDRRYGGVKL